MPRRGRQHAPTKNTRKKHNQNASMITKCEVFHKKNLSAKIEKSPLKKTTQKHKKNTKKNRKSCQRQKHKTNVKMPLHLPPKMLQKWSWPKSWAKMFGVRHSCKKGSSLCVPILFHRGRFHWLVCQGSLGWEGQPWRGPRCRARPTLGRPEEPAHAVAHGARHPQLQRPLRPRRPRRSGPGQGGSAEGHLSPPPT